MFNFFSEIKKELNLPSFDQGYNLVNINGMALYAEGHKGLVSLSKEVVRFKVKNKIVSVCGRNLKLRILSSEILSVIGEIENVGVN